ncbi:MAG: trypsin-like peptidase domain-containing protein [Planctomycetes bacterium]|nr:trypsin-like peptidase domain-containing protein [Planctomycetota bacterium]
MSASAARAQQELGGALEQAYRRAAEKAAPWVVSVRVSREEEKTSSGGNPMLTGGVFNRRPKNAPTSGTLIDEDGYVVTSYFNVKGKLKDLKVVLSDGEEKKARLVGYHGSADIALLKIDLTDEPSSPKRSPLNQWKVGMPVVALGRGPDGQGLCLSSGIISAPARLAGRAVQTDARLNYGNVGGPLVDLQGRLIGVTCKVDTKTAASFGQNSGVSFAVTWDQLDALLPDLRKGVKTERTGQPFLGVQADPTAEGVEGVVIESVVPGSAAEEAGIKPGDVLVEFDGAELKTFDDLRAVISKKAVGDEVQVKLRRGEEDLEFSIRLGERPGD